MAATKAETPAQKGSSGRGPLPLSILALTQAVLEGLAVAFTGILIAYFMVDRLGYWSLDVYVRASLVGAALYVLIADLTGAYEPAAQFSLSEAWRRNLRSWLTATLLIATLGFVLKISEAFSRLWAGLGFILGLSSVVFTRPACPALSRRGSRPVLFTPPAALFRPEKPT